jgi:disulfide bond formation protein DsbB
MRFWPKSLSDEEYIERVRKQLRFGKWQRLIYFVCAVGFAIILIRATQGIIDNIINLAPAGQQNNVIGALAASASVGLMLGIFTSQVLHALGMSLHRFRTEQLLVDCWDRLENRDHTVDQTSY